MTGGHPTYPELRERWERVRKNESAVYHKGPERKRGRAVETAATLEAMYFATGNKVYADAFQAMQKDGFIEVGDNGAIKSAGKSWKYRLLREKNAEAIYVSSMDELVRQNVKHRHAAATVAVTYFIPGESFDAVVTSLETAYRKFERSRGEPRLKARSA